jgi:hypothetical protein
MQPVSCQSFAETRRLVLTFQIENPHSFTVGLALPPLEPIDWFATAVEREFQAAFEAPPEPDSGLVAFAETRCGPGVRAYVLLAPGERIARSSTVHYSELTTHRADSRVLIGLEATRFAPSHEYEQWSERTCWRVRMGFTSEGCALVDVHENSCADRDFLALDLLGSRAAGDVEP